MRKLVPDAELPGSFDDCVKATNESISKMQALGETVVEMIIDPKEYVAYCRASGIDHNTATLGAFTVFAARKQNERRT